MKQGSLLIAFCALICLPAFAQSTTTVEKNTSRITVTTQKVDESGKTITETWIAEGNEPTEILKEMPVSTDVIQKVEINTTDGDQERIFYYRAAGDNTTAEITLDGLNPLEVTGEPLDAQKVIIVTKAIDAAKVQDATVHTCHGNGNERRAYATVTVGGDKPQTNCAAMGVLIGRNPDGYGAAISGIIEQGGAQEAGLQVGDIIKKVDEFDVNDYQTLFFALSHFSIGDETVVVYDHQGKTYQKKVLLKGWDQIPGQEFRARTDCGNPEKHAEYHQDQPLQNEDQELNSIQPLELSGTQIYPNPTDGIFSFSFTTAPGPLAVTVTDINGKIVYRDLDDNNTGYYAKEINIKDLPQGNYILGVLQGEKRFSQQISKQ
jgi:hypothetical protein